LTAPAMTRLDTAALALLGHAQREAEALGVPFVTSTTLLLAFLAEPSTAASKALTAAGIERDAVLSAHKDCLGDRPLIFADEPVTVVRDAIASAIDEADRSGVLHATADDLFVGLLIQRAGLAAQLISRLGGDVDTLIREVIAANGDSRQGD
jgi:ATP-dependent Clp protease ATP-binding subunit ClpA